MIDHITFGIYDFERSTRFYDKAFQPLGVTRLAEPATKFTGGVKVAGYGESRPYFWIAEADAVTGKLHIALSAKSRAEVDGFYAAAIVAGGVDNGPPGPRPNYDKNYYSAFVLDPDGHNMEAVCRTGSL